MDSQQQMQQYIGIKIIHACPMTREDAEKHLGRNVGGTASGPGMLVRYDTGYEAWSPLDAFDTAYRRSDGIPFGLAIEAAKKGLKIARKGRPAYRKAMYLQYQIPDENSKMSCPYLYMTLLYGTQQSKERYPWQPSQADIIADDWMIIDE